MAVSLRWVNKIVECDFSLNSGITSQNLICHCGLARNLVSVEQDAETDRKGLVRGIYVLNRKGHHHQSKAAYQCLESSQNIPAKAGYSCAKSSKIGAKSTLFTRQSSA